MSNQKYLTLESLIRSKTLPKALMSLCLITLILFSGLIYFSDVQTTSRHKNYIARFENHVALRLVNIQTEAANLAQNNLMTNSIIDFDFQERSLPVFFQSLKLSVKDIAIGFADFQGELVTSNNKHLPLSAEYFSDWKAKVLGDGESYLKFHQGSLFIAEPILYSNLPEAAIVLYIKNFSSLIGTLPASTNEFILFDKNNIVLFSTNLDQFPLGSQKDALNLSGFYTQEQSFMNWSVLSIEPVWKTYENLLPLFVFLLLGISSIIIMLVSSIRIASKQASKAVKNLQVSLNKSALSSSLHSQTASLNSIQAPKTISNDDDDLEIKEFTAIESQFSQLLYDLSTTSLSRNTLASVVDSLGEVLLVVDLDNQVVLLNHKLDKLLIELNLSLPEDIHALIPSQHFDNKFRLCSREVTYHKHNFPALSENLYYTWQRSRYISANGEHIGYIFSGNDISQKKATESELIIKNRAIDEANTAILICETAGNAFPIIYANNAFETLSGYTKTEVLGTNCRFLQGPNSEKDKIERIRVALAEASPLSLTLTNYRKDGTEFKNRLTLSPISDNEGKMTHVVGLLEDVSERVKANALIREAHTKAEESARLKSDFLASMSHEIRTPMNGILGMLNIIKETNLDKTQLQQVQLAAQSAKSLLVIINDILDFSKIEAGKLDIEPVEFDLFEEVSNLIQSLARNAHQKGVEIVTDLSGFPTPYIIGDPVRIKQIITNLVSNAIKFTDSGTITVRIWGELLEDKSIKLQASIKDQGIGIKPHLLNKIFDTFTQADNSTTREYGGTGLGLSISRQLCLMMEGDISVESELGKGSEFKFELKLAASSELFSPPETYQGKQVLILDSNATHALSIAQQLKAWKVGATTLNSISELINALKPQGSYLLFIDEQILNQLEEAEFRLFKSALESISASDIIISTWELTPYINKRLFGTNSQNEISHYVKPITPKELIEYASHESGDLKLSDRRTGTAKTLFSGINVLLVEDNYINQLVAKNILETSGATVTVANDGREALQVLLDKPDFFALILMDCQMPYMDGYEASTLIRQGLAGEENTDLPIIALTANALKGDKEKCLAAGMNDHISKPINVEELKKTLITWLPADAFQGSEQAAQQDEDRSEPSISSLPQSSEEGADKAGADNEQTDENVTNLAIWDETEMLHRVSNNLSLAAQLVEVFCLDVDELYQELMTAIESNDQKAIGFTAHTLKGVASNISGLKLAHLCATIEQDAKNNQAENISSLSPQLEPLIEELKQALLVGAEAWK